MLIDQSFGQGTFLSKLLYILSISLVLSSSLYAQNTVCNLPGQQPSTAIQICADSVYHLDTLPSCKEVYRSELPGCYSRPIYSPIWLRFKCYRSGSFGFRMRKDVPGATKGAAIQHWVVYDITGKNPEEVYTNPKLAVLYNIFDNPRGKDVAYTGAAPFGRSTFFCDKPTDTLDNYCRMLSAQAGHDYLMLITPDAPWLAGVTVEFGLYNSTAIVINPGKPAIKETSLNCDGRKLQVVFNKLLNCNSLAPDGSDFSLSAESNHITSALVKNCIAGYMDTIELTFNQPLPPGDYSMYTQKGTDGNTLYDACGNQLIEDTMIKFKVLSSRFSDLDTVSKLGCLPESATLTFAEPVLCTSIANDGSDFTISGPSLINITRVGTMCHNGYTKSVQLFFDKPISTGGKYQIVMARGTDNNTLLGECQLETPVGRSVEFDVTGSISPRFSYTINSSCKADTVHFSHPAANLAAQWTWTINNTVACHSNSFSHVFKEAGEQNVQLTVSNGACSNNYSESIVLNRKVKAAFDFPKSLCPEDKAEFRDKSIGNLKAWYWNFDNGFTSNHPSPGPQKLSAEQSGKRFFNIQLIVTDLDNCADTARNTVEALTNCYIAVPNAFTPNHDGKNDWLFPLNTNKARQIEFLVYNRYGQRIFRSVSADGKWDGTLNGLTQPPGLYLWSLSYTDTDTGKRISLRGSSMLIR